MEAINPRGLYTYSHDDADIKRIASSLRLARAPGHVVSSYIELLEKCAQIKFHNNHLTIFFRGQALDWHTANASNLYPSIYRIDERGRAKRKEQLFQRYDIMTKMEERLLDAVPLREVHADRLVRWALLQHYEICPTPLLDVTPSLQVALSFALEGNEDDAFLYLFGVPHVSGPISISVDAGTQIIQLAQLCPPSALRAHFQEAALLCSYPVPDHMAVTTAKGFLFDPYLAQNFSCRLVSKFHLKNCRSWSSEDFHRLGREILRPDSRDEIYKKTAMLRTPVT